MTHQTFTQEDVVIQGHMTTLPTKDNQTRLHFRLAGFMLYITQGWTSLFSKVKLCQILNSAIIKYYYDIFCVTGVYIICVF